MNPVRNVVRIVVASTLVVVAARTSTAQPQGADSAKPKLNVLKNRATAPAVIKVLTTVRPTYFTGKCPVTLHFAAHLTVKNPPVKVQYQWLRSDSAKGPVKEITIKGEEGIVGGESWELGGTGDKMAVAERLQVLSPNVISSHPAGIRIACK